MKRLITVSTAFVIQVLGPRWATKNTQGLPGVWLFGDAVISP